MNKENSCIWLGEIYGTSVLCANSSQMLRDHSMRCRPGDLGASIQPFLRFLPGPALFFLPSCLKQLIPSDPALRRSQSLLGSPPTPAASSFAESLRAGDGGEAVLLPVVC